jgi:superfamily II DNA or RNA helicase
VEAVIPTGQPTVLRLPDLNSGQYERAKTTLTYHDRRVEFELKKAKKSFYLQQKLGPEGYAEHIAQLQAERHKCLLRQDGDGLYYTMSGLAGRVAHHLDLQVKNEVFYPDFKGTAWVKPPKHDARQYQNDATEKLLEAKHAAVEMGTGLGKSRIIMMLAKEIGLKTVVMTPSRSIAGQIYDDFVEHLGKKYVGMYGDGKKDFKKKFVIAIGASLTKVEPSDPAYEELSSAQVFIADESHLCPADTLVKVCEGLCSTAPYRFFFSGTQIRGDGLEIVLEGITGPIVYSMSVKEGVEQGYLSKPHFRMFNVKSEEDFHSNDANEMTRKHLFYNPKINKLAAGIANQAVTKLGHPVVILIDEMEQFAHLLPYLKHEVGFAHGGVTKDNASKVPSAYHKSDPKALVKKFNAGELPILIGTSCISTGTDIRAVKTIIDLVGGKSETQFKQAVGRGTRLKPDGNNEFWFFDFRPVLAGDGPDTDFSDLSVVYRHAINRAQLARDIYPDFKETTL